MRYNTIIPNDVSNGEGVCVSFFVQGCPHHCKGCFNPETWDPDEGQPFTQETKWEIIRLIGANGLSRNFSVLGGEPMALYNLEMTEEVVTAVRTAYPNIKIFLWTGFKLHDLIFTNSHRIKSILSKVDYIIDEPFEEDKKDLGLKWRGSRNQHVWENHNGDWRLIDGQVDGRDANLR